MPVEMIMPPEPSPSTPPPEDSEEAQLCLGCLTPNPEMAHFCSKCGAPMTGYAATGPFEQIFAEGHVYRQAVQQPRRLIVVLGMWLIFGLFPAGLIIVLMSSAGSSLEVIAISAFMIPVSLLMIWKTTANYLKRPRQETIHED